MGSMGFNEAKTPFRRRGTRTAVGGFRFFFFFVWVAVVVPLFCVFCFFFVCVLQLMWCFFDVFWFLFVVVSFSVS